MHKIGMSCKKRDAFHCVGTGFRESDVFVSQLDWGDVKRECDYSMAWKKWGGG